MTLGVQSAEKGAKIHHRFVIGVNGQIVDFPSIGQEKGQDKRIVPQSLVSS